MICAAWPLVPPARARTASDGQPIVAAIPPRIANAGRDGRRCRAICSATTGGDMAREAWRNSFDGPDGQKLVIVKFPWGTSDAKALEIAEEEQDKEMDPEVLVVPMVGEPDAEPGLFGRPAVV